MRWSETGRWNGKVTSRPLPECDPSIDALSDDDRATLVSVWHARAATERRVADSFTLVSHALRELNAAADLIALSDRAIDDEHRHAELSRYVASRYAGKELDYPPLLPFSAPKHTQASDELRHTLHVLGQCAFNETIASAFLEACCEHANAPLAKAACRELLSDEIDHARIGWAQLAASPPVVRNQIVAWLPSLANANLRMWRESPRKYPSRELFAGHGAPSEPVIAGALATAFRELIIPGFEHLGMPTGALHTWMDAECVAKSPVKITEHRLQ